MVKTEIESIKKQ